MDLVVGQLCLPLHLARRREGRHEDRAAIGKDCVERLPVAENRAGSSGRPLVFSHGAGGMDLALPELFSRFPIKRINRLAARTLVAAAEIDTRADHGRRTAAATGNLHTPAQIFFSRPGLRRRLPGRCLPIVRGATPRRPVAGRHIGRQRRLGAGRLRKRQGSGQQKCGQKEAEAAGKQQRHGNDL